MMGLTASVAEFILTMTSPRRLQLGQIEVPEQLRGIRYDTESSKSKGKKQRLPEQWYHTAHM